MTGTEDDDKPEDEALERLIGEALAERDELLPITEDEVARAEERGVEFEGELPLELREPGPAAAKAEPDSRRVVDLDARRESSSRNWVGHGVAAVLGAAAATVVFMTREPAPAGGPPLAGSEPVSDRADARAPIPTQKIRIAETKRCSEKCCAGARCKAIGGSAGAPPELETCASGRTCVACGIEELAKSRYRIRVGAFALDAAGAAEHRAIGGPSLETCVRVGSSELVCAPAHANADGEDDWTLLPLVTSTQDALAGFELVVRPAGGATALGTWRSPVRITPTVLCSGLAIKPKSKKGELVGRVSVFLEDTHYVELLRGPNVEPLLEQHERLEVTDVRAKIFETGTGAVPEFVLSLGPVDAPTAERLRWLLLDQGEKARMSVGADYQGRPRPLD